MADLTLDEQQLQEQALEYARKNKKAIALRQRAQDAKVPDQGSEENRDEISAHRPGDTAHRPLANGDL